MSSSSAPLQEPSAMTTTSQAAAAATAAAGEGALPAGLPPLGPEVEAFNYSLCLLLNSSALERLNATEECAAAMAPPLPMALMTIIQVFYALVCVVGLCGNTLVIYVVLRYSKMQTVTNLYILNLALADECFLVGIPFLIVTSAKGDWIFGMAMCKIYLTTTSINQFTSSIFLTVMSADRYVAVCHPISSPRFRTNVIARIVSLTAWATSALLMVPVFMYAATITKESGGDNCNIFWPFADEEEEGAGNSTSSPALAAPAAGAGGGGGDINREFHVLNGQTAFTFYSFVLGFAVPLTLILIFYTLVIFKLKTVGPKNKSKEKKKSHRKVTRLVLTVITVYILCWLPYWITQLALIFTPPGHRQDNVMVAVMLLAGCLSYSNSAMNPVLYAFLSENFKKSFMKACTCATGRDANAVLHVENSAFPRKRTLLGGSNRNKGGRGDRGGDRRSNRNGLLAAGGGGGDGADGPGGGPGGHHRGGRGNGGVGGDGGGGRRGDPNRLGVNSGDFDLRSSCDGTSRGAVTTTHNSTDVSTGVTTCGVSSRSASTVMTSAEVNAVNAGIAPASGKASTLNGSLAPPQMV